MQKVIDYLKSIKIERKTMFIIVLLLLFVALFGIIWLSNSASESKPQGEITIDADSGETIVDQIQQNEPNQYEKPDWAAGKPQDPSEIEDLEVALPYSHENFTIYKGPEENSFIVEYSPFTSIEEVRPDLQLFFIQNNVIKGKIYWNDSTNSDQVENMESENFDFSSLGL
jgi:hypothetical protein